MDSTERGAALAKAADDRVRAAQHGVARALQALAAEANEVAAGLVLGTARDRITSHVVARYTAYRNAVDHLEAERAGAAVMRQEAMRLVQQRSA